MPLIRPAGKWQMLAVVSLLGCACGGERASGTARVTQVAAVACSDLAAQYAAVLLSDARLCDPSAADPCSGRRPTPGVEMSGDTVVAYLISSCPATGSGVPVNLSRTEALDALLGQFRDLGCDLSAAPGCGAPGWAPAQATCLEDTDGAWRCQ